MKKSLFLCGALLSAGMFTMPAHAVASTSYYVSGDVGSSWFNNVQPRDHDTNVQQANISTKAGIHVLGALGVKWCDNYRLEAEYSYQRNDGDKYRSYDVTGNFSVTSVLANGYYDFKQNGFVPYLTAGIGWASLGPNNVAVVGDPNPAITESHSALGYQLGAGVAIPVAKNVDIDARYRHFGTSSISLDNNQGDFNISSNSVLVGLRVGF